MPIEVPNLDDRSFADLVEEALSMLPRHAPSWTNHNASDPGITLIELLAYFTEMLIYRLNRVSRENKIQFLQLLGETARDGRERLENASLAEIDAALRNTVLALREPQRAVTPEDFEFLARQAMAGRPRQARVVRAHCELDRNLDTGEALRDDHRPGHISVIIVPDDRKGAVDLEALINQVDVYLQPKCLLTTRLHVVGPQYLWVSLGAIIHVHSHVRADEVRKSATQALEEYFSPLPGNGPQGRGWPFGRYLYLSEVFDVLERVPGIESVEHVHVLRLASSEEYFYADRAALGIQIGIRSTIGVDSCLGAEPSIGKDRLLRNDVGQLVAVALKPYELPSIVVREENIRLDYSAGFAEAGENR